MKNTKTVFVLFILVAAIQLMAPAKMIFDQQSAIDKGKAYKFLTQPIDPNDPFRGKFIRMNYQINNYKTKVNDWDRNSEIYVYIKDSLGYAKLDTVTKDKLKNRQDYIKAKLIWYNKNENQVNFNILNDRFYMEESKAKPAEDLVRDEQRDSTTNNSTYALIYIKNGTSVLKDVFVNDVPIKNLINDQDL